MTPNIDGKLRVILCPNYNGRCPHTLVIPDSLNT